MQQTFPCHNCGWQNVIGQRFCGNCAEVFHYNCPYCNVIVDPEYATCPSCGSSLVWGFQQQEVQEVVQTIYQQPEEVVQEPLYQQTFSVDEPAAKTTKVLDEKKLVIIAFIGLVLCIGGAIYLGLQTFKSMNQESPLSAIDTYTTSYLYEFGEGSALSLHI